MPKYKKNRMPLGAPGAAPEGPKNGLFFKNFQILKFFFEKWGAGRGPVAQTGFEGKINVRRCTETLLKKKTAQKYRFFMILGFFQILPQNGRQMTPGARKSAQSTQMTL